jgi:hypothetical protein
MHRLNFLTAVALIFSACNLTTPVVEIQGAYFSPLPFALHACPELLQEFWRLDQREANLAKAHHDHKITSDWQAVLFGFGKGDGVAASELANVRGQQEVIISVMTSKDCQPQVVH